MLNCRKNMVECVAVSKKMPTFAAMLQNVGKVMSKKNHDEIEKFFSVVVEVSDDDVGTVFIRQTPDGNQLVQRVTQDEMDWFILSVYDAYESAKTSKTRKL